MTPPLTLTRRLTSELEARGLPASLLDGWEVRVRVRVRLRLRLRLRVRV